MSQQPMTLTQAKEIIADLQRGLAASQNERIADLARIQELEQNLAQQQTAGIALKKERDALREAAGNLKDELKTLNASQPPTQHRQPQPQPESQQNASNPAVPVQSFFDSEHLKRTQEQSANHAQSAQTTQPKQPVASPLAATSQSDFDALRRKHGSPQQPQAAPVEETVPVSTVQGLIQQAREGIIAEARAELEVIRKNADFNLSNIIAEGNEEITRIKSIAQNLYDENTKMKSIVHNSQEQHEILLKKEVQIFNLMEDKKALEEKLRISRNEFQDQKVNIWHLEAEVKDYKKAAIENSNAYKEEQQRRTEANIREVNALEKLAHWESEMKEELAKRDRAETRRFLKERSQVRISPNNYRRFSHVSPIVERTPVVQEYVPGPPYEFLTRQSIRNPSGTINTSKNESLRRKANTNTPKTIAKSQRGKKNEVDYNGKPADKFLKVLGITSAIGLVGMAGERGYLW